MITSTNSLPNCKRAEVPAAADFRRRPDKHYWSGIVIHHTGIGKEPPKPGGLFAGIAKWLTDKDENFVSAHALIDVDGSIGLLVDPQIGIAWHAGVSKWFDMYGAHESGLLLPVLRENCNDYMLGIELVGDGNKYTFTEEQYTAVASLCAHWTLLFSIPPNAIVGHYHIAPTRKVDPGKLFDWQHFYVLYGKMLGDYAALEG